MKKMEQDDDDNYELLGAKADKPMEDEVADEDKDEAIQPGLAQIGMLQDHDEAVVDENILDDVLQEVN